ncbi:MAG: ABC transporter permease [Gammaproteobacteria bacterium]|nr:ABC transporter permease [Gammaproteobacteria bacterium]MCY4219538.1 ABC transporter permease [Gammaproteobacteria bacterium]MCY4275443.1 ABC transporter permease [Gammaproteobacteria bacterium]
MKSKSNSFSLIRVWEILFAGLFMILIWQAVVWTTKVESFILPAPLAVANAFISQFSLIWHHTLITAIEVLVGLVLGVVAGILTALNLTISKRGRQFIMPALVISQTIPVFALAPLLTLWLGYGLASKIAMAVLIVYFPVTSTFLDGLSNTPKGYLDLAHTMRSPNRSTLMQIRVPAAIPSLTSGIRLAAVYAPIGAVIGEWVGASNGLGYLMLLANGRVKIDLMFAALVALCVLTVTIRAIVGLLCNRLEKWSGLSERN